MVAAVCGGFLKPGPRYKAATPGVTVNGSVCSPLSCANGSGAARNCGRGEGGTSRKQQWAVSVNSPSLASQ